MRFTRPTVRGSRGRDRVPGRCLRLLWRRSPPAVLTCRKGADNSRPTGTDPLRRDAPTGTVASPTRGGETSRQDGSPRWPEGVPATATSRPEGVRGDVRGAG